MFYFKAFFNSIYNLAWLRGQKNNGKQVANYIVLFIILLSTIYATYFTFLIPKSIKNLSGAAFEQVPNFKVELRDGKLKVENITQPFVYEGQEGEDNFKIVIDTVSSSTPTIHEFIDEDDAYTILFSSDAMTVFERSAGQTSIQSFEDAEDVNFTKQDLESVINSFLNNTALIFVLLLIFWFIIFAFSRVVYLLFLSLLVYLVAKFFKPGEWKFSQIYTIALFAVTLPSIISAVLALVNAQAPYLFSIITLGIMSGVVFLVTEQKVAEPQTDDQE